VTLTPPTRTMRAEAAKNGFYKSLALHGDFPRLQILSIEGLLEGRERAVCSDFMADRLDTAHDERSRPFYRPRRMRRRAS
jgi:hypothetical protein